MMTSFTPLQAILGGSLIGASAVALMVFHGRIAGMAGIISGLFLPRGGAKDWRIAFLAGAILAPLLIWLITGQALAFMSDTPVWGVLLSGLIVGIGVTFAGGCTSGHGVCGNARLSPRSMVATVVFMLTTFVTVYVVRHILGGF